jgi:DNA-binding transcriptional ArsR family regulator
MQPDALAAVASERRREILRVLWEAEMSAGELAAHFDVSWPAVSQHLTILRNSGLVAERRQGRHRYYRADAQTVGTLAPVLREMWEHDLDRLAHLAEAEQARQNGEGA